MTSFESFGLDPRILSAIARMGYSEPTPIQTQAIPVVLKGGDVMGAAQTGTGKTAGFGLPLLARILPKANTSMSPARHPVRALILTPTRELADQVSDNLTAYAADTPLRVGVVYGGVDIRPQADMLRRGIEVLTATPGRLLDHVAQKSVNLSQVEIVVLDEADRMLDMGFLPDISRILQLLPKTRQSLMFSATFSEEITKLAKNFLKPDPAVIKVARQNQTAATVTQELLAVTERDKTDVLIDMLRTRGPEGGSLTQVLVFVNAKITCRRLARTLERVGINADAIHGDKTQEERQVALDGFKSGAIHVLVATDVAARGLDIKELPFVINYDVPYSAEDYVHRIGRTGRAGSKGVAVMLSTPGDARLVEAIEKLTKQTFKPVSVEPMARGRRNAFRRNQNVDRVDTPEDERLARERARAYVPPAHRHRDPLFDMPYVERSARQERAAAPQPAYLERREKKRPVAALLGGFMFERSTERRRREAEAAAAAQKEAELKAQQEAELAAKKAAEAAEAARAAAEAAQAAADAAAAALAETPAEAAEAPKAEKAEQVEQAAPAVVETAEAAPAPAQDEPKLEQIETVPAAVKAADALEAEKAEEAKKAEKPRRPRRPRKTAKPAEAEEPLVQIETKPRAKKAPKAAEEPAKAPEAKEAAESAEAPKAE